MAEFPHTRRRRSTQTHVHYITHTQHTHSPSTTTTITTTTTQPRQMNVHLGGSVGFYSGNVLELLDDVVVGLTGQRPAF